MGPAGMSPTTRIVIQFLDMWPLSPLLVFLAEVGLDINRATPIAAQLERHRVGHSLRLVSGAVVVYVLAWIVHRIDRSTPTPLSAVLFGRAARRVSLALVLSLSADFPQRDLLAVMAFGVVLLHCCARHDDAVLAQAAGAGGPDDAATGIRAQPGARVWLRVRPSGGWNNCTPMARFRRTHGRHWCRNWSTMASRWRPNCQDLVKREPTLRSREMLLARREMLRAQRSAVTTLLRDSVISDEVYGEMISQIDGDLVSLSA